MAEITLSFPVEYAEDEEVESALQPVIETAKSPYLAPDQLKHYISLPLLAVPGVALIEE